MEIWLENMVGVINACLGFPFAFLHVVFVKQRDLKWVSHKETAHVGSLNFYIMHFPNQPYTVYPCAL
jgi:hypothetical protein